MPNFAGFFLTPVISLVRSSAAAHNGSCTWEFSQIKDPVASIIGKNKISEDGICEMLSAKWIELHATDGHLANWLAGGGKSIDASKVRQLMQLFIIGSTMNRGAIVGNAQQGAEVNQTEATTRWLAAKGVMLRKSIKPVAFIGSPSQNIANVSGGTRAAAGGSRNGFAAALAGAIGMSMQNGTGSYRTIGIWGPGGGHAMAAWVAQDVAFFDPNFGEFWFEKRADFVAWWPTFFSRAGYSFPKLGLGDRYEIMDYAKAR